MSVTPDLYAIVDAEIERQDERVKIRPQRQTVVVEQLKRGATVEGCARSEGAPRAHVIAVGFAAGLVHDTARDVMIPRASGNPAMQQQQSNTQPLLARAADRSDAKTVRLVKRLQDVIAELTAHLDELESREARERQAERERARLQSEEAKLAARLAEIRSQLGKPTQKNVKSSARSVANANTLNAYRHRETQLGGRAVIVAWAKENNLDPPHTGRLPNRILDAFEAQLGTKPEGDTQ